MLSKNSRRPLRRNGMVNELNEIMILLRIIINTRII
jgi:hypothetical protein